jgi:TPR repeat protein
MNFCLQTGLSIECNLRLAVEYDRFTAAQGHAGRQINFGFCVENGVNIAQNLNLAAADSQLSVDSGDTDREYNIGL